MPNQAFLERALEKKLSLRFSPTKKVRIRGFDENTADLK